jgi:hypothetical protein
LPTLPAPGRKRTGNGPAERSSDPNPAASLIADATHAAMPRGRMLPGAASAERLAGMDGATDRLCLLAPHAVALLPGNGGGIPERPIRLDNSG